MSFYLIVSSIVFYFTSKYQFSLISNVFKKKWESFDSYLETGMKIFDSYLEAGWLGFYVDYLIFVWTKDQLDHTGMSQILLQKK
jgi:hypothetical protein